jgi:5'-nucleotidase
MIWLALSEPGHTQILSLRIIAFNDFHGHIASPVHNTEEEMVAPAKAFPNHLTSGAALGRWIDQLRSEVTHSLLLSSGDAIGASPIESSLFFDEPTIQYLNLLRVDAVAVGNHEFDQGLAHLLRLAQGGCETNHGAKISCSHPNSQFQGSNFPWLAGNLETTDGQNLLPAYSIKEFEGVKIGIIGLVTAETPQLVRSQVIQGLRFRPEIRSVEKISNHLKALGVNTQILLIHEGGKIKGDWNDPTCPKASGRLFEILPRLLPYVDLVFSGHTHQGYACLVDGKPVMQADAYGKALSVVDLKIDTQNRGKPVTELTKFWNQLVSPNLPPTNSDVEIKRESLIANYQRLANNRGEKLVGSIDDSLHNNPDHDNRGDSTAGQLIADAQWWATRLPQTGASEFALMNPGGIRSNILCKQPPCSVSYAQLFEMQPFDNQLVVMSLSGQQIKNLFELQSNPDDHTRAYFLQPSHQINYFWNTHAPQGQRVENLNINGQPMLMNKNYRVTVNSFLAGGGDRYFQFRNGHDRLIGPADLDAVLEFLQLPEVARPSNAIRITVVH